MLPNLTGGGGLFGGGGGGCSPGIVGGGGGGSSYVNEYPTSGALRLLDFLIAPGSGARPGGQDKHVSAYMLYINMHKDIYIYTRQCGRRRGGSRPSN